MSQWTVHGRRSMYESDWVNVYLDDVELPDGHRISHHVVSMPKASQTAVVLNRERDQILLIWRHRFITNTWGWEVPAGWVEPDEEAEKSIRREILEETGYEVDGLERRLTYHAIPGLSTMKFTSWLAVATEQIRSPDRNEVARIGWHPVAAARRLLTDGGMDDGASLTALSAYLATTGY